MKDFFEDWKEGHGFFPGGPDHGPGHQHGPKHGPKHDPRHEHSEDFGRGPRGPRHWPGGGRGHGRPFDHGELRFILLELIAEKPRHGYEIIRTIEERMGGSYSPSPGVVYPTLTLLEEMGYAVMQEEGGRKQYSATDAGKEHLAANRPAGDEERERFRGRGFSPKLERALHNLKLSLRLRLRQGPISDEQSAAIADALDAVVAIVESGSPEEPSGKGSSRKEPSGKEPAHAG